MVGRPIIDPPNGKIPYQPWAADFAAVLLAEHKRPSKPEYLDPVPRGFQEGLPRINYQGPFQIHQLHDSLIFTYDYHHRWTPVAPTHMVYIVTIEDPKVYTQPWKLRVDFRLQDDDEQGENAVWEGNKLGGLPQEFWGDAKK